MLIKNVLKILNEYNASGTNATLAAMGGKKATGKNYDNMITGQSQFYKDNDYTPQYAEKFPALAALANKVKSQAVSCDVIVPAPAMKELQLLMQEYNPRTGEDGTISLPFGDGIRLKTRGNIYYIGTSDEKSLKSDAPAVSDSEITN